MSRQAVINGNFNVWQRGTSLTISTTQNGLLIADRWKIFVNGGSGGTLPSIVYSKGTFTSGELYGAFNYHNIAPNGAGTSLGNDSYGDLEQRIENGVKFLCGDGKKVTLSFWAKSDIASKRIGIRLTQYYGTGGSPSASETINGTNWTLTSTWTKYTYTFTTNTLSGKTFGTANDEFLGVALWYQWGSDNQATFGSATAEGYRGSGNIAIAQVQLCAGDVALPFMPKSYDDELRACQRYARAFSSAALQLQFHGVAASTTVSLQVRSISPEMRIVPTLTATAGDWKLYDTVSAGVDLTDLTLSTGDSTTSFIGLVTTVASGLTQYRTYYLGGDNSAARKLILEAEL
jgi:hypothetical protein